MSKAQLIFDAAFNQPRQPRSEEYKEGARYVLALKTGECASTPCPYPAGSVQADAFFHGAREGHDLYRAAKEAGRVN